MFFFYIVLGFNDLLVEYDWKKVGFIKGECKFLGRGWLMREYLLIRKY